MDFRKNYCIYHPSELITNFCRESSHSVSQNNAYCLYAPPVSLYICDIMCNK
jgi:hypothetical protein